MDEQEIQKLLQMNLGYQAPSEQSREQFIIEFQHRQRALLLRPSLLSLLQEKLFNFVADFKIPTLAYVAITSLALLISVMILHDPAGQNNSLNNLYSKNGSFDTNHSLIIPSSQGSLGVSPIEPVSFQFNKYQYSNTLFEPQALSSLYYRVQKQTSHRRKFFNL